jgi:hypothetical protein
MNLSKDTKIGLTIGQLFSVILIFITMMVSYANFSVRINSIEIKQQQFEVKMVELEDNIDNNRTERMYQLEQLRQENREEHRILMEGQAKILEYFIKK